MGVNDNSIAKHLNYVNAIAQQHLKTQDSLPVFGALESHYYL